MLPQDCASLVLGYFPYSLREWRAGRMAQTRAVMVISH
jgi:hypothetical protein